MTQSSTSTISISPRSGEPPRPRASERPPDLPGCTPFLMTEDEAATYEGRIEAWDARTRTAWSVREPTTIYHEQPSGRLGRLAERVASVRGSPVECFGSADLVRREPAGGLRWLLQADEIVYLDPRRTRPRGPAVDVDRDPLPDVTLEVDHTTDVRRWKLPMYMEWGFPEIWVLVPWPKSVRTPGLTIHVREEAGYRESPESLAFPGWRSREIHRALTEEPISGAAWRALERVGRTMGGREGTRPEDDPLTRSLNARARAEGNEEGRRSGRAEAVLAALRARGIDPGADFAADEEPFAALGLDTLMAAALACTDAADFRKRTRKGARVTSDLPAGRRPSPVRRSVREPPKAGPGASGPATSDGPDAEPNHPARPDHPLDESPPAPRSDRPAAAGSPRPTAWPPPQSPDGAVVFNR